MICVIDRKETTVEYRAGCLYLRKKGKKVQPIPINQLDQLVVYGNPLVQTAVWRNLAAAAVPVIMLSVRGKPQCAMLGSGLAVRLPLRRMQHRLADHAQARVEMARWFVSRKFRGYCLPLAFLSEAYRLSRTVEETFCSQRERAGHQLQMAVSVGEIMGIEGKLAHNWFELLTEVLPEDLRFKGRNRRPPRDPVNSLLSLGYTLLLSEVRRTILTEGFDPSLGFLHQDYPGRETLALDFMEIFRTGVDLFVLQWIRATSLDSASFYYRKSDGCRLSKRTRPLFYQAWAGQKEEWPRFTAFGDESEPRPLRELLVGQTARAREFMEQLEERHVSKTAPH